MKELIGKDWYTAQHVYRLLENRRLVSGLILCFSSFVQWHSDVLLNFFRKITEILTRFY